MRELLLALGCVLLVAGLAGCIGSEAPDAESASVDDAGNATRAMAERANVTQIPAELAEVRPLNVTTDDVTLRGHVYLPEGEGPLATVLEFSPYRDTGTLEREEVARRTISENRGGRALLEAGFAFAVVNVRGTEASSGCFAFMNIPQDGRDANAVVDAIADEPWSNGQVGMHGLSYDAATAQAATAYEPSPHLDAVVSVSGVVDVWNWLGNWGHTSMDATLLPSQDHLFQGLHPAEGPGGVDPDNVCLTTAQHTQAYAEFSATGDKTSFLRDRDIREEIGASEIPILATVGVVPISGATEEQGDGHINQLDGLWQAIPHEDKRFLFGHWGHGFPTDSPAHKDGSYEKPWMNFTRDYSVRWFDHHLRGGPEEIEPSRVDYQDPSEAWHASSAWPPAEATRTPLHLSDGEIVATADEVEEGRQVTVASPGTPFPTRCEAGADKGLWVSEPLSEDVLVAGNAFLNVTITSTQPDENLLAHLWSVDELIDGCGEFFTSSAAEQAGMQVHAVGSTDLAHRGHLEQGEPFPVGEPGVVEMQTDPLVDVLPEGSRLALTVKGGAAPSDVPRGAGAQLVFQTGSDTLGELWLPVVEGELVFEQGGEEASVSGPRLAS